MSRREKERYQVWLPVKVDGLKEGLAITHDVSGKGLLMVTASTLDEGSVVKLAVKLPGDAQLRHAEGRVVRVEENDADPHGLWPHRMAIELEEEIPELAWIQEARPKPERRTKPRESEPPEAD